MKLEGCGKIGKGEGAERLEGDLSTQHRRMNRRRAPNGSILPLPPNDAPFPCSRFHTHFLFGNAGTILSLKQISEQPSSPFPLFSATMEQQTSTIPPTIVPTYLKGLLSLASSFKQASTIWPHHTFTFSLLYTEFPSVWWMACFAISCTCSVTNSFWKADHVVPMQYVVHVRTFVAMVGEVNKNRTSPGLVLSRAQSFQLLFARAPRSQTSLMIISAL